MNIEVRILLDETFSHSATVKRFGKKEIPQTQWWKKLSRIRPAFPLLCK
jgi:hypothetical protein